MNTRISNISLIAYAVLLVLSCFLLSTPGNYWLWYAVMTPFAITPLAFGSRWKRIAGGVALGLCAALIISDVQAGKQWREEFESNLMKQSLQADGIVPTNESRPEHNGTKSRTPPTQ